MGERLDIGMPVEQCISYQVSMTEIVELREKIAELERENAELKKQNVELTKIIKDLKAKLAKYENPHTPSSAQRYKKKSESKNSSKRRGAPNGHRGATRPTPEPGRWWKSQPTNVTTVAVPT
jgi:septal ring factor EnvC (AmiA/AmiB activator)